MQICYSNQPFGNSCFGRNGYDDGNKTLLTQLSLLAASGNDFGGVKA
jgi:hypothetical protein